MRLEREAKVSPFTGHSDPDGCRIQRAVDVVMGYTNRISTEPRREVSSRTASGARIARKQ
jgi:hypothetical protein